MAYCVCGILILFLTAVAASPRSRLSGDEQDIQNVLQKLLARKATHQHVRNEHGHNSHHNQHHDDHDRTNIETLNLVFKNNKIIPPSSLSKAIARTGGDGSVQLLPASDMMCKLGARCGCGGGKAGRCGCGRSDGSCDLEHDHTYDNTLFLKRNPDYINAESDKNHYSHLNDKKNHANPAIVKLLDDLEKSLLIQSNDNQNINEQGANVELLCVGDKCDNKDHWDDKNRKGDDGRDDDKKADSYIDTFLKDLEKTLDYPVKADDGNKAYLRCCQNCARKSYYHSSDDDKAYLHCFEQCSKSKHFKADDSDRRDRSYYKGRDSKDRSDTNQSDRARIFQINDNLDALVVDVSDVDNILKLLNNGNNYDHSNSIGEYVRNNNAGLEKKPRTPKTQNRLLPPTFQQKMKIKDIYRRSGKPGVGQYGLPFELDIQGLGQLNP